MPDFVCATDSIATDETCSDKGGLLTVYWIDGTEVDWATMATDPTNWSDSGYSIQQWALDVGATFGKLEFEREQGRLDSLYTLDNGFYEVSLLNLVFRGHSTTKTVSLGKAVNCCNLVCQIFDNNGKARVIGKEFINGAWVNPVRNAQISRHLDTHGAFGAQDDRARDELDLLARHSQPPVYSDVTQATMDSLT